MENIREESRNYLKLLRQRAKESRIYKPCQSTGLAVADFLMDPGHKALYMRLAKQYDNDALIQLAKEISMRKEVKNKGAYFMSALRLSKMPKFKEV